MQNRNIIGVFFLLLAIFASSYQVFAQDAKPDMQTLLQSKNYLFTAQYAQPLSGSQITLTSTYTLRIAGDSLVCQLPYYGRAYVAENFPAGSEGLMFTSHHFDYTVTTGKHNRYMVSIKINDRTAVQQMYINVSKNGYANLSVTPTNKQAISYYGNINELKKRQ